MIMTSKNVRTTGNRARKGENSKSMHRFLIAKAKRRQLEGLNYRRSIIYKGMEEEVGFTGVK